MLITLPSREVAASRAEVKLVDIAFDYWWLLSRFSSDLDLFFALVKIVQVELDRLTNRPRTIVDTLVNVSLRPELQLAQVQLTATVARATLHLGLFFVDDRGDVAAPNRLQNALLLAVQDVVLDFLRAAIRREHFLLLV